MTLARKNYTCILCCQPIPKGTDHTRIDVTPWTSHPDSDPGFASFRSHSECYVIWEEATRDNFDRAFPPYDESWVDILAMYEAKQKQKEVKQ